MTYGEGEIERLMTADGIVHSRAKIAGTIANARALKALAAEYGDVAGYARSFADYDALYADAKKRFAYLGDLSCYYWLFRTGLPVPRVRTLDGTPRPRSSPHARNGHCMAAARAARLKGRARL